MRDNTTIFSKREKEAVKISTHPYLPTLKLSSPPFSKYKCITIMAIETLSIASLRSKTSNTADIYYTTDPGQEGEWYYDATDTTSADNVGTILVGTSAPFMRFKRIHDPGWVNVKWFGAKGNAYVGVYFPNPPSYDGVADDTPAIQMAINTITKTAYNDICDSSGNQRRDYGGGTVFFPAGAYRITQNILIGANCTLKGVSKESLGFPYSGSQRIDGKFQGSLITCDFPTNPNDNQRWAIRTATYYTKQIGNSLVPYDQTVSGTQFDAHDVTDSSGITIENLVINGKFDIYNPNGSVYHLGAFAYGCIKITAANNVCIRNVGIFESPMGILLNACYSTSAFEHILSHTLYYGICVIDCSVINITECMFNGHADHAPFPTAPRPFIWKYNDTTNYYTNTLHLNDDIRVSPIGIYSFGVSNLAINISAVQTFRVGALLLQTSTTINGLYMETIPNNTGGSASLPGYGVVIAGANDSNNIFNAMLTAENLSFAAVWNCFFFGQQVTATIKGTYVGSGYNSNMFVPNSAPNRLVTFANTLLYANRKYTPDILFLDETPYGPNVGSVYVDPDGGDDENYGFNENDPIRTFDAALIRVLNQSTLNPVKKILVKKDSIAEKSVTTYVLQNVSLIITSYGAGDNPGKIRFNQALDGWHSIGNVDCRGNVELCFREIDLEAEYTGSTGDYPSSSAFIQISDSYLRASFERVNIELQQIYAIFGTNHLSGVLEARFINSNITGSGFAGLANKTYSTSLLVDCLKSNSLLGGAVATNKWNSANVIRSNF